MSCRGCSSGDGCSCSVTGDGLVITVSGTGTPVTDPYLIEFDGAEWMSALTEDNTDCATLSTPRIPVILGTGAAVSVPLPCVTAVEGHFGGSSFAFRFLGDVTDTDPGDGCIKFDNATYSSVTKIYIDLQDELATSISDWIDGLTLNGRIRMFKRSDPSAWIDFTLTAITSASGYRKLDVTYNDHAGALNNDVGDTVFSFTPGSSAVGPTGAAGGVSFLYTYSTTTTDADPGTGTLRLNNASYASVTQVFIDLLAFGGADVTDFLDSLDDSTNPVKGTIKISAASDQTKWVVFSLTSTTTVAGYRKLVVTYVDHNGALTTTAGDTMVSWSRAGDAAVLSPQTIKSETTDPYTLVLADAEKWINVGGSGAMTVTIPLNATVAFPIGTHIDFWNVGAVTIDFLATGGVTIQSDSSFLNLADQYTGASLVKTATDTWALFGKLS